MPKMEPTRMTTNLMSCRCSTFGAAWMSTTTTASKIAAINVATVGLVMWVIDNTQSAVVPKMNESITFDVYMHSGPSR